MLLDLDVERLLALRDGVEQLSDATELQLIYLHFRIYCYIHVSTWIIKNESKQVPIYRPTRVVNETNK